MQTKPTPCLSLVRSYFVASIYHVGIIDSTGYAKALKKYLDPVQARASILRNEQGSDNVDLEGKVIMITG